MCQLNMGNIPSLQHGVPTLQEAKHQLLPKEIDNNKSIIWRCMQAETDFDKYKHRSDNFFSFS